MTMKMARPSERDIEAAGKLMGVLDTIDRRRGGPWPTDDGPRTLEDAMGEEEFDCEDVRHLQALYNELAALLRRAPNFHGRVIGGMCYAICWDRNAILDPAASCLELHPDIKQGLRLLDEARADFLPRLEREARAAVAATIEQAVARHLAEMGG